MTFSDPMVPVLIAMGSISLLSWLAVFLFNRSRLGNRMAESEIRVDSRWTQALIAEPGKRYNLCLEFQLEHSGGEDNFGLVIDYCCTGNGSVLVEEKAGIGNLIPSDQCRRIMVSHRTSLTSMGGWSRYRATVVACTAGPFSTETELKATGVVTVSPGTRLNRGVLFFSRQGW